MTTNAALTPDQQSVQQSLQNMGQLVRDIHNFTIGTLSALFQLDKPPPSALSAWESVGESVFLGLVGTIPEVGSLVQAVAGAALDAALKASAPQPGDFKGAIGQVSDWLDRTFLAAVATIDGYAADVPGNWTKSFTAAGITCQLSSLAASPIPAQGTPPYDVLVAAGRRSTQCALWQAVMKDLFRVIDFNRDGVTFDSPIVTGTSAADVRAKLAGKGGDLTSYYTIYGTGATYFGRRSRLAYNHNGTMQFLSATTAQFMFLDDALGNAGAAADTAFCTHAQVFGNYDPTTGAWTPGTGWIDMHFPF